MGQHFARAGVVDDEHTHARVLYSDLAVPGYRYAITVGRVARVEDPAVRGVREQRGERARPRVDAVEVGAAARRVENGAAGRPDHALVIAARRGERVPPGLTSRDRHDLELLLRR